MAVTHAFEALSLLGGRKDEKELSYDLVLANVHMPDMDGFELLQCVKDNFNIPVILISADDKTEVICKGLNNGAPTYLLKPLKTDDVKQLWKYSILWKNREKNACRRFNEASVPRNICPSSSCTYIEEASMERKNKKLVWPAELHSRFVEAILILGAKDAVPRKILEVMNVPCQNVYFQDTLACLGNFPGPADQPHGQHRQVNHANRAVRPSGWASLRYARYTTPCLVKVSTVSPTRLHAGGG